MQLAQMVTAAKLRHLHPTCSHAVYANDLDLDLL